MLARLAAALVAFALAGTARAEDSLRCERGLVAVGDLSVDLLGKCGAPALRERRLEDRELVAVSAAAGLAAVERLTSELEEWTYDFGRNRFLQLVTLRNGRIERIERGGYGHGLPPAGGPGRPRVSACDLSGLHAGDTRADALGRCGAPAATATWRGRRTTVSTVPGTGAVPDPSSTVQVEEWVYNLGPQRFLRIVRFEDGRVVKVETGGYGYPE